MYENRKKWDPYVTTLEVSQLEDSSNNLQLIETEFKTRMQFKPFKFKEKRVVFLQQDQNSQEETIYCYQSSVPDLNNNENDECCLTQYSVHKIERKANGAVVLSMLSHCDVGLALKPSIVRTFVAPAIKDWHRRLAA